jgi:hypothetical protein
MQRVRDGTVIPFDARVRQLSLARKRALRSQAVAMIAWLDEAIAYDEVHEERTGVVTMDQFAADLVQHWRKRS